MISCWTKNWFTSQENSTKYTSCLNYHNTLIHLTLQTRYFFEDFFASFMRFCKFNIWYTAEKTTMLYIYHSSLEFLHTRVVIFFVLFSHLVCALRLVNMKCCSYLHFVFWQYNSSFHLLDFYKSVIQIQFSIIYNI